MMKAQTKTTQPQAQECQRLPADHQMTGRGQGFLYRSQGGYGPADTLNLGFSLHYSETTNFCLWYFIVAALGKECTSI